MILINNTFLIGLYNKNGLIYPQLKNYFNYYIASLIQYKYLPNITDVPSIGEKIFNQYFPDGNMNDPLRAVKVSIFDFYVF